ncbi:acetyltransferase [Deltaproteobacteria bacterium IMCC39524]|nr:acetyltransferase [Deltaproteobacteria bacterium IMCC39524]
MKKVILAGNAVTADILNEYLMRDTRYEVVALTVDDEYVNQGGIVGLETIPLSKLQQRYDVADCVIIMAVGYNGLNRNREALFGRIKAMGYIMETYIHPDAKIYTESPLGEGSVVLANAVLEPHAKLGADTLVWCNTTLAHHSEVGDHCWIASGSVISGHAVVKNNVFLGVNATVVNKVIVDEFCIIGGGALITKSTKPSSVHLARSAEELRFTSEDYDKHFGI